MNYIMKLFSLLVSLVFSVFASYTVCAQEASIDYFEFNVDPTVDSNNHIYYIVAIANSNLISNLSFVVTDEHNATVTQLSSTIASLKAANAWRLENDILYLTIETGAHAPSLYYKATATLTPVSGEPLEYSKEKRM